MSIQAASGVAIYRKSAAGHQIVIGKGHAIYTCGTRVALP